MTNLSSLIERIGKSEGADRDVDLLVDLFARPDQWAQVCHDAPSSVSTQWCDDDELPRYTASIDAAMTLVPEHSLFTVRTLWDDSKTAGLAVVSRYEGERRFCMGEHQSVAATPALALCAAALKARNLP